MNCLVRSPADDAGVVCRRLLLRFGGCRSAADSIPRAGGSGGQGNHMSVVSRCRTRAGGGSEQMFQGAPRWSRSVYERFRLPIDGSGRVTRHSYRARIWLTRSEVRLWEIALHPLTKFAKGPARRYARLRARASVSAFAERARVVSTPPAARLPRRKTWGGRGGCASARVSPSARRGRARGRVSKIS